jgi:hypothetical protein
MVGILILSKLKITHHSFRVQSRLSMKVCYPSTKINFCLGNPDFKET